MSGKLPKSRKFREEEISVQGPACNQLASSPSQLGPNLKSTLKGFQLPLASPPALATLPLRLVAFGGLSDDEVAASGIGCAALAKRSWVMNMW